MAKRKSFKIRRPGGLTAAVGGKPSQNLGKVRKIARKGSKHPMAKGARLYLNVFRPASQKRKRRR